jgi:phenylacetate-CoA ligase
MIEHQWLDHETVESLHNSKLLQVLRHAVTHVPRYSSLMVEKGWTPAQLTHEFLAEFPLVDKTMMTEEQESFLADDVMDTNRVPDATGGSSGVWFGFYYDSRQKDVRRATHFFSRTMAGWRPGDPLAVVWGHREDVAATTGIRKRLIDSVLYRQKVLNAYDMDEKTLQQYAVQLGEHRPRILVGYASALVFLAEYLGRQNRHDIRPVGIVSSAETLDEEMRKTIETEFQCPVFNRYGSREFANIAQQCDHGGGLHVFANRVHVEIIRPDGLACLPGETGEIIITDLINGAMPFIRYRTGDIGSFSAERCPCGRGWPLLAKVEGRVSDIIVGKNGKYYSCQSPRLFGADIPGIGQMQVIQESLGALEVKVVPADQWCEASEKLLIGRMRDLLGDIQVTITLTDHIPPAPSGKYRFTISKVSPFSQ